LGINKLFKEFWEILRNFGALAEEFQNLVVRALTTRPVMHVVNSSLKIRGIQNPTVFFSQPKTQSYIVGGGYPSVTL
jgi:hypothetical protein